MEKARVVLAENLKALMAARPALDAFPKIVAAGGPSNGTLDRIRRAASGCSVDQLDLLAKVFELQPWQLMTPGLDPTNPPMLVSESEALRALYSGLKGTAEAIEGVLREHGNTRPGPLTS
jgi:hypothetical protein